MARRGLRHPARRARCGLSGVWSESVSWMPAVRTRAASGRSPTTRQGQTYQTRTVQTIDPTTRLAPSPTGALHLGNARTFVINWLLARALGWRIVLRIEDLDGPRVKPEAADAIMRTLAWLGLDWDSGPFIQSHDLEPCRAAMTTLASRARAYPSDLTRGQIESAASAPQEGAHEVRFDASLRPALAARAFDVPETNWRFATPPGVVAFDDLCSAPARQAIDVAADIGDFVVWTRRAVPAYQLAVVVDDHRQGVTDVVRARDLLPSAARQLLLYRALGLTPEPRYRHLAVVVGHDGRRLAKRHGDTRVDTYRALGVPPQAVLGWIMSTLCAPPPAAPPAHAPCTLDDLMAHVRARAVWTEPDRITFSPEDDQWLKAQSRR